jgi:cytochrome c553
MRRPLFLAAAYTTLALASAPSSAADANHGHTLYNTYCISCHGSPPSGGPELAANNPSLIRFALNNIAAMQSAFSHITFTDADLADIAAYVASLSAPPPPPPPPPPVVPAFDYTDLWWNHLQAGWGMNIIQHAQGTNNIFAVMYIYDDTGHATWFILPGGTWVTPTRFTGPWARVSGSPASAAYMFNPPTQVGTATIDFTDRNNATITFTVNGVATTKTMEVLPF